MRDLPAVSALWALLVLTGCGYEGPPVSALEPVPELDEDEADPAGDGEEDLAEEPAPSCNDVSCPEGYRCDLVPDEEGRLSAWCVEGEEPACDDVTCGAAAACEMVESCDGAGACELQPTCVALACEEQAPTSCEASCETGYLMVDGSATCACCSPADEPAPRLCLVDAHCEVGEACDHSSGCVETCEPGKPCAQVCYGRCADDDLVPDAL